MRKLENLKKKIGKLKANKNYKINQEKQGKLFEKGKLD